MQLSSLHPWVEDDEKSRPPGPSSEEEVGAVLCPLIGAEQEVAKFPCWFVVRSLMLHEPFPWRLAGQRNGRFDEGYAGGGPDGSRVRDPRPLTPSPGSPCVMPRVSPTHWVWWDRLGARLGIVTW